MAGHGVSTYTHSHESNSSASERTESFMWKKYIFIDLAEGGGGRRCEERERPTEESFLCKALFFPKQHRKLITLNLSHFAPRAAPTEYYEVIIVRPKTV